MATAQPTLADQRNASPRAVCSICRLCEKAPWLLIVRHTTSCQSHIMGPISGSCGNHISDMFEIPTRRTEGEHSLQRRENSACAVMATHKTRCLSTQCGSCITIHSCDHPGVYVQSTVYHLVSRNENCITPHPFLPPVRHFLSRTQSVQQGRGYRSP